MKHKSTILVCIYFIITIGISAETPWQIHGPIKASDNGHFLVHEDGTLFFWNGDTPWAILSLDEWEIEQYLMDRSSRDFNVIQVMATRFRDKPEYGFMTAPGLKDIHYLTTHHGEIPFTSIDPPELNEAYWAHVDYLVEKAAEYGIYVALVTMWGRGADWLFNKPIEDNFTYGKLLGERYKDNPNVIWIAAGEFVTITKTYKGPITEQQEELLRQIGRGLKAGCHNDQLISIHGNQGWKVMPSTYFHEDDWCDFYMNQSWNRFQFIDSMMVHDWNLDNPKPTFLSEAKYEGSYYPHYTKNMALGDLTTDWHVRLQAYWSVFSGGFGHTYGALGLWDCNGYLNQNILHYPGADDMRHLKKLMESHPSLTRIFDNSFIETNIKNGVYELNVVLGTRDDTKTWAFVYTSKGTKFTVDLTQFDAEKLNVRWYDPRLGVYKKIGVFETMDKQEFDPPGKKNQKVHKGDDWVLVLEKVG